MVVLFRLLLPLVASNTKGVELLDMDAKTWVMYDKSAWGDGPWLYEPDKVQWTDDSTGLTCMALRNHHGVWCGYVGVERGHPLYGRAYDDVDVDVHGGLTFAGECQPLPAASEQAKFESLRAMCGMKLTPEAELGEARICHTPRAGEPDDLWWLGFDCGHAMDYMPGMEFSAKRLALTHHRGSWAPVYRTLHFVREECRQLAAQIVAWK